MSPLYLVTTLVFCLLMPSLEAADLEDQFHSIAKGFKGRAGVCAIDDTGTFCLAGNERFSLQSVMKLVVVLASLDAVDRGSARLNDSLLVQRADLSLYVQPIAKLVGSGGYRTTISDLMHRAVVDSDSAAADILFQRFGGSLAVERFLQKNKIEGLRVDRDERHLQTEIVGLSWRSEYVERERLNQAIASVPASQRTAAWTRYRADVRDTSTPLAMAQLLHLLAARELLSPSSTRFALDTMAQTTTFADRLKGGVPPTWLCMHKTGTSGTWDGVTAAINDVGILRSPQGKSTAIAVFLGDVRTSSEATARVIRQFAGAVTGNSTIR